MESIQTRLEKKLDSIYQKIDNPAKVYQDKLRELQKEAKSCDDILKLQLILRRVDKTIQ
jgi:hypothetical protein